MRRFVLQFALFLLPLCVAAPWVDRFLTRNLQRIRAGELGVWNDIYAGRVDSDVIVNGASRATVFFDPDMIARETGLRCYNIGIVGYNFGMQYARHGALLEHNRKPRVEILSVDVYTLVRKTDLYNPDQYLPYMRSSDTLRRAASSLEGYGYFDYRLPLVRFYGKHSALLLALRAWWSPERLKSDRVRGYEARELAWTGEFERAKATIRAYELPPDPAVMQLFERYLTECRRDGIQVVLVNVPEYAEAQGFVRNRPQILAAFAALARAYAIPFFDYSSDEMCAEKKYFYNSMHVNRDGAELFTAKLLARLQANGILPARVP